MKATQTVYSFSLPPRRKFFTRLAKVASLLGIATLTPGLKLQAHPTTEFRDTSDLEAWFNKMNGKHKMVFDAVTANEGFQVIWAHIFLETNNQEGVADNELGVMVVLRNKAIALALEDRLWKKYKLGKFFKINDKTTGAPADRNLFHDPAEGEMPDPGMTIKKLLARNVMFCVCEKAMAINSKQVGRNMGLDPTEVEREWSAGLIPGIRAVPSGVLALNRAQERGASYCYAG